LPTAKYGAGDLSATPYCHRQSCRDDNDMSPTTPPVADDAADTLRGQALKQWRREQRKRLLDERLHAGGPLRHMWNESITAALHPILPDAAGTTFGMYWPFKGEYAIRPLMRELFNRGGCPALPHVAQA